MSNKTVTVSYALIGAAVVTSILYTKKLERDVRRSAVKMRQDRIRLQNDMQNLAV